MGKFVCAKCGHAIETRCKPKKCPGCGADNTFDKKA
ncbi:MAG: RCKP-type rubredoxin-like domain-containing protein [Bacillota bacterium]